MIDATEIDQAGAIEMANAVRSAADLVALYPTTLANLRERTKELTRQKDANRRLREQNARIITERNEATERMQKHAPAELAAILVREELAAANARITGLLEELSQWRTLAHTYLIVKRCGLCGKPSTTGYICPHCDGDDTADR